MEKQMELPLPVQEVSVNELERIANLIADLREEKAEINKKLSITEKELGMLEERFINLMDACGKEEYRSAKCQISIKSKLSVKMPATDEDKQAFFEHLRSKGLFDSLATLHSNSLKTYYESARAEAIEKGVPLMEFSIPGIKEVSEYKDIGFSRNKR